MHPQTADLRIRAIKPLLAPAILEEEIPLDDVRAALVARTRREVGAIVTGTDDRLLVVVGRAPSTIPSPRSTTPIASLRSPPATRPTCCWSCASTLKNRAPSSAGKA